MMPQDERNAWVLEKMKTALVVETQQVNFKIRGLSVCPKAWRMYYYVTEYRYYKSRRIALGELPFLPHGNSYRYYESPKTDTARDYIQRFIDRYCDIMPHISEIALPPKMERCDVWNEYIKHCEELLMLPPEHMCGLSHFLAVLRTDFPNVCCHRKHHLGRCDVCVTLALALENAKSAADILALKERKQIHLRDMFAERDIYKKISEKAANDPKLLTSLVFDHANGIRVPHVAQQPKSTNTLVRPRIEVWGMIDHSNMQRVLVPHLSTFPHDANLTITLLYNELYRLRAEGKLSKVLHLQLDNCAKENKNRWLLGFFAYLIGIELFTQIVLDCLPPGHTHVDIDALFSLLSKAMELLDAGSFTTFLTRFLKEAYKGSKNKPALRRLDAVFDFKAFVDPFLRDFSHFQEYRSFRFTVRTGIPAIQLSLEAFYI